MLILQDKPYGRSVTGQLRIPCLKLSRDAHTEPDLLVMVPDHTVSARHGLQDDAVGPGPRMPSHYLKSLCVSGVGSSGATALSGANAGV